MSIFSKKEVTAEPIVTGIDVLRKTIKARDHKAGFMKALAREVDGVGIDQLEKFAEGKADLSVETLKAVANVLYAGHSEYDPETNLMRSANKTPPTTYAHPPRWDPKSHPFYTPPREAGAYYAAPQPVVPVPAKPTGPRPGWA